MTEPLRITIVTYNWPPRNAIGVHRPYGWAKHWALSGHQVRVLTAQKHLYDAPLDLHLPELAGVEVVEFPYGGATASVSGALSSSPAGAIGKRFYRKIRAAVGAAPDVRDAWHAAFRPHAKQFAMDADIVVSTFGPRSSHLIASEMKAANPCLFWLADYRDLWSQNHIVEMSAAARSREHRIEAAALRAADLLSTVSPELADQLSALHGRPTLVVPNGFDVADSLVIEALRKSRRRPTPPIKIVYTGKIYPNLRDPSPLLQVVLDGERQGRWPPGAVEVHIYGAQTDGIDTLLKRGGYGRFVKMHGHVARDLTLQAQRDADLLLLLESPLPEARGMLTGKLFEYLTTGIPILSLGSGPDSAIARVLEETGAGVCASADPIVIGDVIAAALSGAAPPGFNPQEDRILRYSRRMQAEDLLTRTLLARQEAREAPAHA